MLSFSHNSIHSLVWHFASHVTYVVPPYSHVLLRIHSPRRRSHDLPTAGVTSANHRRSASRRAAARTQCHAAPTGRIPLPLRDHKPWEGLLRVWRPSLPSSPFGNGTKHSRIPYPLWGEGGPTAVRRLEWSTVAMPRRPSATDVRVLLAEGDGGGGAPLLRRRRRRRRPVPRGRGRALRPCRAGAPRVPPRPSPFGSLLLAPDSY